MILFFSRIIADFIPSTDMQQKDLVNFGASTDIVLTTIFVNAVD
jgi:hypothetical protein